MRSLLVLSIALCLGLATAAPATDLLRALLKRAEEAEAKPEKPEDGGEGMPPGIIPTENEFKALAYLGYSVEWLVNKAADPEAFIAYMDAEMAKDAEVAAEKRGRGDRKGKGRKGGKSDKSGEDKPKGAKDWESDFEKSIMKVGVYKTVLKHVGIMSTMLKHSGAIFAHMVSGPDCKDCPELPEEVMAILLGEEEDKEERRQVDSVEVDSVEELNSADAYPMKGKRPQGGKRPKEGPHGRKDGKGQKSGEDSSDVDAAFGQEAVSELAKRLLKLFARK